MIGDVIVAGNWIASDLVAGARVDADPNTAPNFFGDPDDEPILVITGGEALIESITINGLVIGTAGSNDHYGLFAPEILSFKSVSFDPALLRKSLRKLAYQFDVLLSAMESRCLTAGSKPWKNSRAKLARTAKTAEVVGLKGAVARVRGLLNRIARRFYDADRGDFPKKGIEPTP